MKRKLIAGILTAMMAIGTLSGCGGSGESASQDGKTTIIFMNHTGEEKTIAYEDELIEAFEAENEDIDVEVQRMSMDD